MSIPHIDIVVARARNGVIGKANDIPWKVKGEQRLFKEITQGGTLIMGRKTFESIGRPLPGRLNIVVTRQDLHFEGCESSNSLDQAISIASQHDRAIFVIGGGAIYEQALPITDGIYISTLDVEIDGDIYFPPFPNDDFVLQHERYIESNINYTHQYFTRR
ncbi:MAG: dihydrofolate reductase [Pseudomonadota bacterium]